MNFVALCFEFPHQYERGDKYEYNDRMIGFGKTGSVVATKSHQG